jgi:hypothetical protein
MTVRSIAPIIVAVGIAGCKALVPVQMKCVWIVAQMSEVCDRP